MGDKSDSRRGKMFVTGESAAKKSQKSKGPCHCLILQEMWLAIPAVLDSGRSLPVAPREAR